jgi:hypothetical protein
MKRHLILLALLVAGCSAGPTPSPTSARLPTSQPAPSIDERLFGEIVDIDPAVPTITLALGQMFGAGGPDEANAAARADGVIGPGEDLPNPFYVRDLHERRTLPLDSAAKVLVLGWDADGNTLPTPIGLAEFVTGWRSGPASEKWQPAGYYWCLVADGGVVGIEAEYTP